MDLAVHLPLPFPFASPQFQVIRASTQTLYILHVIPTNLLRRLVLPSDDSRSKCLSPKWPLCRFPVWLGPPAKKVYSPGFLNLQGPFRTTLRTFLARKRVSCVGAIFGPLSEPLNTDDGVDAPGLIVLALWV